MNTIRAKEITESGETIRVTYNEVPIFIQHVDESTETARIYPLDEPGKEMNVPVSSLKE